MPFIPHYYVIYNGCVYALSRSMVASIDIIKKCEYIANILRKSDQLRGIRDEQIKDLKNLYYEANQNESAHRMDLIRWIFLCTPGKRE